jgi:alpha-D-xyloside xylohydrolase
MKFTDGQWLLREGVTAAYPSAAHEVEANDQRLRVLAPTFPVRHRGDLLKGPILTLDLASPLTDVISVTLTHFAGEHPGRPEFDLATDEPEVEVRVDDEVAMLTSGRLSARVHRGPDWRLELVGDGQLLTASGVRTWR